MEFDRFRGRIFLSPRRPTVVGGRGLGGCWSRRELCTQVSRHAFAQFISRKECTYTLCVRASAQNNNNHNNSNKASWPVCISLLFTTFSKTLTVGLLMAERELTGSARRRRERQLRSWLRRERMIVRMELAAALHHSAFKSAGPETNDTLRRQKTVNSKEEAVFFELYDEDTASG